jgi:hypothetical protein
MWSPWLLNPSAFLVNELWLHELELRRRSYRPFYPEL